MPEMSIQDAIEKRAPSSMHLGGTRDSQIITEPCPKCGSRVLCIYVGTTSYHDYYDEFGHICLNPKCDHFLYYHDQTGELGGGRNCPASNRCHFCDRVIEMPG